MLRHIVMKAVFVLLTFAHSEVSIPEDTNSISNVQPSYAKWGRIAMEETAKTYRDASIVDYKYEGRTKLDEELSEERFVLWLRKDSREFGVRVRIMLKTSSEELIQVRMNEIASK